MACGTLTAGFARDCANPVIGGVDNETYLIDFDVWLDSSVTISGSEITAITLPTGKLAYKVESIENQVRPNAARSRDNGIVRYTHSIGVVIDGDDGTAKDFVATLEKGRYVAITFTNSRQIEVYGNGSGLIVAGDGGRNRYEQDGRQVLTLSSDEETLEVRESLNYVGTSSPYDFATAKAEIVSLAS